MIGCCVGNGTVETTDKFTVEFAEVVTETNHSLFSGLFKVKETDSRSYSFVSKIDIKIARKIRKF